MTKTIELQPRRMTDATKILEFIVAGNSTFTLVSLKSGKRFTYKAAAAKKDRNSDKRKGNLRDDFFFVSLMTSGDNENGFTYLGSITKNQWGQYTFGTTRKTESMAESDQVKGLSWLFYKLQVRPESLEDVEFWHEGRCCVCGRKLTVPESVEAGIGPECAGKE